MTNLRRGVTVLSTLAVVAFGLAPAEARAWILGAVLLFLVLSFIRPSSTVTPWCLFVAGMVGLKTVLPAYDVWPVHLALPLLVVAAYSSLAPGPGPTASWASLGSFAAGVKVLTGVVALVSALGFVLWVALARPEIAIPGEVSSRSPFALVVVGCVFAAVNAVLEELVFRGIALNALSAVFHAKWPAVILQAAAFGALHYASPSIPGGLAGVSLTFLYGMALGLLAVQAEGILASSAAHFVADVFVFLVMVGWM